MAPPKSQINNLCPHICSLLRGNIRLNADWQKVTCAPAFCPRPGKTAPAGLQPAPPNNRNPGGDSPDYFWCRQMTPMRQAEPGRLFPGFHTPERPAPRCSSSVTALAFISSEEGNKDQFHLDWIIFGAARCAAAPAEPSAGRTRDPSGKDLLVKGPVGFGQKRPSVGRFL